MRTGGIQEGMATRIHSGCFLGNCVFNDKSLFVSTGCV